MSIDELKGLGPKSKAMLAEVGITSVEQFMQSDPYELYARLKKTVPGTSLNMLYGILGAQEGIDWKEIAKNRRAEILMRLDDMGLAP